MRERASLVWFFLPLAVIAAVFAIASCGGEPDPESSADVILMPACPDPRHIATGVAIYNLPSDRRIAIAKADTTDEDAYRVSAIAFRDADGEVEEVEKSFEWEISDPNFLGYRMWDTSGRRAYASLRVQEDIFERGGDAEPEATLRICVQNDCCGAAGCSSRVCTDPVTVIGVPSLEGRWFISGLATGFTEGTLTLRQSGRELRSFLDEFRPVIRGRHVVFYLGNDRYEGEIHPTLTHISGIVIRTNDLGDDERLGQWTADKVTEEDEP